ncbi:MAG: dependent epimerase/dehydratase family protein [Chthoniobacteraceae bacterium]|nr:dependent epimerase/dehydratase family protein [Chthoniobacteraceae bacterium]
MKRVFVAGCGFVGLAVARLLHREGWDVVGGTHSNESAANLGEEPFPVIAADLCDREALGSIPLLQGLDVVVHCASSRRGGVESYRAVYLEGARNLIELLQPGLLVFTGSTSVYAQLDGEWVTEESTAEPDRETGRILRQTERLVLEQKGIVARLAGVYGPGRSVLLKKFFAGEAVLEGDGMRWINQAHRDDIATALLALINYRESGIFNVCDNEPLHQRALYEWLAGRFGRALPPAGPIDPNRKRGWTHKRVSNQKLRALGWEPRFPSFFDAVEKDQGLLEGIVRVEDDCAEGRDEGLRGKSKGPH